MNTNLQTVNKTVQMNIFHKKKLQSYEHKPLNNYLIKYRLNYHCRNYHNNDNKQVKYPPFAKPKTYNNLINNTEYNCRLKHSPIF